MQAPTINQLTIFLSLAQELNYSTTADKLNMSVSNVVTAVKGVEGNLGHQLVKRKGRGIVLTDAGKTLVPHAESIVNNIATLSNDLRNLDNNSVLRVGVVDSIGFKTWDFVTQRIKESNPAVVVEFVPVKHDACETALANNFVDAVIHNDAGLKSRGVVSETLSEDKVVCVARRGGVLGDAKEIGMKSFARWPIVCLEEGSQNYVIARGVFDAAKTKSPSAFRGVSAPEGVQSQMQALLHVIRSSDAVGVFNISALVEYNLQGLSVVFVHDAKVVPLVLSHRRVSKFSSELACLLSQPGSVSAGGGSVRQEEFSRKPAGVDKGTQPEL